MLTVVGVILMLCTCLAAGWPGFNEKNDSKNWEKKDASKW